MGYVSHNQHGKIGGYKDQGISKAVAKQNAKEFSQKQQDLLSDLDVELFGTTPSRYAKYKTEKQIGRPLTEDEFYIISLFRANQKGFDPRFSELSDDKRFKNPPLKKVSKATSLFDTPEYYYERTDKPKYTYSENGQGVLV